MAKIKLVPIIWKVMNSRFNKALDFYFGWKSKLPFFLVTKKELHNFAHEFCDQSVYETSKAYDETVE